MLKGLELPLAHHQTLQRPEQRHPLYRRKKTHLVFAQRQTDKLFGALAALAAADGRVAHDAKVDPFSAAGEAAADLKSVDKGRAHT